MNLIPDIIWAVVLLAHASVALAAIFSMSKIAHSMTMLRCGLWAVFIVLVPIIGGVMWFVRGKPKAPHDSTQ